MMRNIPHPVVVVAATGVDPLNHERQIVQAMTVSSFTTVSLSPHAIISFNVKRPSRTLDAILSREAKAFQVKVLSDTPAGAQIADLMVRGTATAAVQDLKASGFEFNLDPPHGEESVLTLKGPGIWGELSCNTLVHKCISVADHVIVVAVVRKISLLDYDPTDVEVVEELHEKLLSRGTGLLYINGSYKSVGESLVPKVNENGSSPDDTLGVAVKDSSTHINVNMFRDIARREGSLHDENAYGHLRHAAWNHHRKGSPYPDALVLEALKE
ncbi:hypothetical protein M501DRAFT_813569 [Patellaria atrata CBS 101060]|uniref:Flavin reductase like domain-containing protein n=1 Tax=Patellaria atrata CBS 101060 TaxID=1346257 RepID=A0A9P4VSG5_9PEZI|nr:hypothetical protein M501DRAFT_813569 [Patellaria atrata CBS 101060]